MKTRALYRDLISSIYCLALLFWGTKTLLVLYEPPQSWLMKTQRWFGSKKTSKGLGK